MQIKFKIEYYTQWGESVWVSLSQGSKPAVRIPLSTNDGKDWTGSIDLPDDSDELITYRYSRLESRAKGQGSRDEGQGSRVNGSI